MKRLRLFEGFGIELEYMIVDRDTLKVAPIADRAIYTETEDYGAEVDHGAIAWSNELVSHVIELKTNGPAPSLSGLESSFHQEVLYLNKALERHNAMLMPTAAHPLFDPATETVIWPHEHNMVYALYDRIFGCKGHGWSNLQSMHINYPFADDTEFGKLHAAIRVLLPILPSMAASSPLLDGQLTGFKDSRLQQYQQNQKRIPIIAGLVVPEPVFTKNEYQQHIFDPISKAIAPHDTEGVLDKHFLNSRGAIARFDRGAIEIRVLDLQECPKADLAIAELVTAAIRWLMEKHENNAQAIRNQCSTAQLWAVLQRCIEQGSQATITDTAYLGLFGKGAPCTARDLWQTVYDTTSQTISSSAREALVHILENGTLSERITRQLSSASITADSIKAVYRQLCDCLMENRLFP